MNDKDFTENGQIAKDKWKDYWRNLEKSPAYRRETRIDKKHARRRIHKRFRKQNQKYLDSLEY